MKTTGTPQTLGDLMARALAMECEAAARYTELAEMMEQHNNTEVAELFRKMAEYEDRHAAQILADMGWAHGNAPSCAPDVWSSAEPPESVPVDEMHYLMHPYHALQLALAAEQRAVIFFEAMVADAPNDDVRRAAEQMRAEEVEHVQLLSAWLARVSPPAADWATDPDPPRYVD